MSRHGRTHVPTEPIGPRGPIRGVGPRAAFIVYKRPAQKSIVISDAAVLNVLARRVVMRFFSPVQLMAVIYLAVCLGNWLAE